MTYDTIDNDVTMAGGAEGALGRIDKYELRRELGEGGFGTVYLARDTVADVDVAVKGLPPEVKHNAVELESIRGNFALVKRLRHPNIVAVTDLHQALSVGYASKDVESKLRVFERDTMIVMDYAPGVTLAQWRRLFPGGKVPLDQAIAVVRQVASALDYAHAQKVLHRDVKPANVMVETSDGGKLVARVLDFGLAAEIRSSMGRLSREIRDTSGTRPYMAPEQWKGERQGPATDQYALAAMFYELVVGDVPFASVFDCGDPAVMRIAVTTDTPAIPAELPKCVRRALSVALAKKPEERFSSCGEFAAALEGKAKIPHSGARTGGAGKIFAAISLLAAIGVGGLVYHQNQERRQAERSRLEAESAAAAKAAAEKAEAEKKEEEALKAEEARKLEDARRKLEEERKAIDTAKLKIEVDAIYVEARVQMGACGRLDPSDGFKSRIEDCQKSFDRAEAQHDIGNWAEAALSFTNVVDECKALIEKGKARDTAKSAAEILADAIKAAQSAGAKEYAPVRFSSATDLAKHGRGEFDAFKFTDAAATYATAKSQFDLAAQEAGLAKQEEARKKREAEEAAQRAEVESRKCAPMVRAATPIAYGGDKPWQLTRHKEKMKLVSAGGAKVVFIGDSITHFWETIGRKYFSSGEYRMLNLGFAGDRTENVLWRIDNGELDGYKAKCVVLLIGTNNTGHFPIEKEPPDDTILGIKTIIERIREKQPTAIIVVTAIFPRGASPEDPLRQRNDIVNRGLQRFCDGKTVLWCDFGKRLLDEKGDTKWVMPDRLHLNAKGFEIWYENVKPYIDYALYGAILGPPPVNAGDTIIQSDARRQVRGESLRPERTHVFDGQALNTLTELEKSEGWELLWDGRTFNGWLAVKGGCKEPPQKGWIIKDGSLTMFPVNTVIDGKWSPLPPEEQKLGGGGDIATDKKFREFVFKFDFRLTKNATSGVKYFYDETLNHGTSEEFQIIDCGHPDFNKGKDGNRRSAALYDILPAHADRFLKDVGEWNTGMIAAKGAHVEHWLNGEKVLEYERGSDAFKAAVNASKYANWGVDATGKPQDWGEIPEGRILLQDHTDSMVSFRNLKIKKL